MWFGLFLCTTNSYWSSVLFVISDVKDLFYLANIVSMGFLTLTLLFLCITFLDLAISQTIFVLKYIYLDISLIGFQYLHLHYLVFSGEYIHLVQHLRVQLNLWRRIHKHSPPSLWQHSVTPPYSSNSTIQIASR